MSKGIKDIYEIGMRRLEELAARRNDILARAESLKNGSYKKRAEELAVGLVSSENNRLIELKLQFERSKELNLQSAAQMDEDNGRCLSSCKQEMELRTASLLSNWQYLQSCLLDVARDRVESLVKPLSREYGMTLLQLRSAGILGLTDLDCSGKNCQTGLLEMQSEISGKISSSIQDNLGKLASVYTEMVKILEESRPRIKDSLEQMYASKQDILKQQSSKIEAEVDNVRRAHLNKLENEVSQVASVLLKFHNEILEKSMQEISESCNEPLAELEASSEYSLTELKQTLNETRNNTNKNLEEVRELLKNLSEQVEISSKKIVEETRASLIGDRKENDNLYAVSRIHKLADELLTELDQINLDLDRQQADLLKSQIDKFDSVLQSTEKTLSVSMLSYKAELKRLATTNNQLITDTKKSLLARLVELENRSSNILSQIADPDMENILEEKKI